MRMRRAAKTLSTTAFAGGLVLGLGALAPTANAMPATDERPGLGRLCQQAVRGVTTQETASYLEGLPGLRCGQRLGVATPPGLMRAMQDRVEETAPPTEDETEPVDETTEPESGEAEAEQGYQAQTYRAEVNADSDDDEASYEQETEVRHGNSGGHVNHGWSMSHRHGR